MHTHLHACMCALRPCMLCRCIHAYVCMQMQKRMSMCRGILQVVHYRQVNLLPAFQGFAQTGSRLFNFYAVHLIKRAVKVIILMTS